MYPPPIFFTHIPKTAGTSFMDSLVRPNVPDEAILHYTDKRQWSMNLTSHHFVTGHFKHGLHHMFRMPPRYITFFREPLDRAVSYYFFIKDCDRTLYLHPLREFADSVDLPTFFQNPRMQNMQTHFTAGYFASEMHLRFPGLYSGSRLLAAAKRNLTRHYLALGLQERFEESIVLLQKCLGWEKREKVEPQKKTNVRPLLADVSADDLASLTLSNSLDIELYHHVVQLFPT